MHAGFIINIFLNGRKRVLGLRLGELFPFTLALRAKEQALEGKRLHFGVLFEMLVEERVLEAHELGFVQADHEPHDLDYRIIVTVALGEPLL